MKRLLLAVALALMVGLLTGSFGVAEAHETQEVGDGKYLVIVGFTTEPIYTEQRNGLDLIIRWAEDGEPISHLEGTMRAEIIAPDGE